MGKTKPVSVIQVTLGQRTMVEMTVEYRYIANMRGLSKKLLNLLLVLLLGFSPMQGVLAGSAFAPVHGSNGMMSMQHDISQNSRNGESKRIMNTDKQHCDQCDFNSDCSGMSCPLNLCASGVMGLPTTASGHFPEIVTSLFPASLNQFPNQTNSFLFRPPRA